MASFTPDDNWDTIAHLETELENERENAGNLETELENERKNAGYLQSKP
jgi:hypothetical protein